MNKSLVFHVKGPEVKDCSIYITDTEFSSKRKWSSLGLVQNVHFEASVYDAIPKISMGFFGIAIRQVEEPDLSDGIIVLWKDAVMFDSDNIPTHADVLIFQGRPQEDNLPDTPWFKNVRALGCVQKLVIDADVKTKKVTLELKGIKSNYFSSQLIQSVNDWQKEMPDWVTVTLKDLDSLQELGTDGVIDHIGENAVLKETLQPILERIKK